jgi:hypothetical protein
MVTIKTQDGWNKELLNNRVPSKDFTIAKSRKMALVEEQKKEFDKFFNKKIIITKEMDIKIKMLRKRLFGDELK